MSLDVDRSTEATLTPAPSSLAPSKKSMRDETKRAIFVLIRNWTRTFGYKLSFNLLLRIIRVMLKRRLPTVSELTDDARDASSLAAFFSVFSSTFVFASSQLRRLNLVPDAAIPATAALIAGPAVALDPSRRHLFALYVIPRAMQGLYNSAKRDGRFCFWNGLWGFGDTALFAVGSAQVMYAYVLHHDCIPASYHNFIVKSGPIPLLVLQQVQAFHRRQPLDSQALVTHCNKLGGSARGSFARRVLAEGGSLSCWALHPQTSSCSNQFLSTWWKTLRTRLGLYITLHGIVTLATKRGLVLKHPGPHLLHTVFRGLRSGAFLSTFCAGYMAFVCAHNNISSVDHWMQYWFAGLFAGCAVLIEPKNRRSELAMYTLPRALESLFNILVRRGVLRTVKHGEVLIFSSMMAIVMHYYKRDQKMLSGLIVKILEVTMGKL